MNDMYALGVDIGGTKIAAVLMNRNGDIQQRSEVASDPSDKERMFSQVTKSIEMVLEKSNVMISEINGIGIGVPGKVDREKGIAIYQNNLPWENFPIVNRLQQYFSIKKVVMDNDVYMAAFAEWRCSDSKIDSTFVYITVSTGISCSIIHRGEFLRGNGFAGELGLFPVSAKSSAHSVERLEKVASGPAIQKLAEQRISNPDLTTQDFFKKYVDNNSVAKVLMDEVTDSLAHGLYSIICLLDPHKVVFGGGVINNNPFLLELIKESLTRYLIPEQLHSMDNLFTSNLKGDSGVIGAGLKVLSA